MSRPSILIVEDNPTTRKMFRIALQAEGLTAVEAGDGAGAIEQMTSEPAQLVLLDMVLPDMDGLELARRLRALPHGAEVPLVAMSGFQRLLDDGRRVPGLFDAFLFKPVDVTVLVETVGKYLPGAPPITPPGGCSAARSLPVVEADPVQLKLAQLSILSGVAEALTRSADGEAELGDVLAACLDAGGIDRCALYRTVAGGLPRLSHVVGFFGTDLADLEGVLGSPGLVAKVIAEGAALSITAPPLDPGEAQRFLARAGVKSAMIVPLIGGGRCAGALLLGASSAAPDSAQLAFGRAIGAYVGQALVLAETFAKERAARAAAEEASRAKDDFLAMLGHELRNPLAPIVTALHLIRMRAGPALAREHAMLERQVKHLAHLVDDLLDVSRIVSNKVELKLERIELGQAVAAALETARPLLEQRGHHLEIAVAAEGLAIDADPARLSQVVFNLVSNAAKYTEVGGHITVSAALEGGEVVLRVRDSGIGIAPAMLPKIFDRFVQERQALDRSRGGLGLGLSIVRSLVTLHGGTVQAHSEGVGRGAELSVRLPAASPAAALAAGAPSLAGASRAPAGNGTRVLIVDDNRDAAELLATLLESLGYVARVAHDGPAALRLAQELGPDVALLDIGLPGMDGHELGRRLRQLPGLSRLPLVAITGYGQDSDRQRSREAGFDLHLVKPVNPDAVAALVTGLAASAPGAHR